MSGWMDLVAAYLQYEAADKASNKKPQYSISPQQSWLFDKLKDLMNYSPTRDYVSSYADSYLKGMNAPNGSLNWKPTFQSDYMKGQQPLPNMSVDLSKLPIFQGDKNGQMPWNPNYTGPGIGGKPTVPAKTSPMASGARNMRCPMNKDSGCEWEGFKAMTGGLSDYDRITGGYDGAPGQGGRNEFGMLVTTMNQNSPQAQQQWNQWFGGLTPEQRTAELQKSQALDKYLRGLGGSLGSSFMAAVKGDPLGFGAALMTAGATAGMSLIGFFAQKPVAQAAGNAWDAIKNGIAGIFGGGGQSSPQGGSTPTVPNGQAPGWKP